MHLAPILDRMKNFSPLDFDSHICPTRGQMESYLFQLQVIVTRVLTTYVKAFEDFAKDPALQNAPRRPLPLEKTRTFPLRVTTCNEATITGTLKVWHSTYEEELERTHEPSSSIQQQGWSQV